MHPSYRAGFLKQAFDYDTALENLRAKGGDLAQKARSLDIGKGIYEDAKGIGQQAVSKAQQVYGDVKADPEGVAGRLMRGGEPVFDIDFGGMQEPALNAGNALRRGGEAVGSAIAENPEAAAGAVGLGGGALGLAGLMALRKGRAKGLAGKLKGIL